MQSRILSNTTLGQEACSEPRDLDYVERASYVSGCGRNGGNCKEGRARELFGEKKDAWSIENKRSQVLREKPEMVYFQRTKHPISLQTTPLLVLLCNCFESKLPPFLPHPDT
eukprot:153884-Pyramimonas_sp.AAC.1